jgi:hypothetical protein
MNSQALRSVSVFYTHSVGYAGNPLSAKFSPAGAEFSLPFTGLVDFEGPSAKLGVVQILDGFVSAGVVHLDKRETAIATGFPIRDDLSGLDRAVFAEDFSKFFFGRLVRNVSDIDILGHPTVSLRLQPDLSIRY